MLISKKNRLAILSYLFKGAPLPCERSNDFMSLDEDWTRFARVAATLQKNCFMLAGCVPIPACAVSGTYTMSGISARDLGGHSVTLIEMGGTYNQIESDGMPGGGPTMIPSVMH